MQKFKSSDHRSGGASSVVAQVVVSVVDQVVVAQVVGAQVGHSVVGAGVVQAGVVGGVAGVVGAGVVQAVVGVQAVASQEGRIGSGGHFYKKFSSQFFYPRSIFFNIEEIFFINFSSEMHPKDFFIRIFYTKFYFIIVAQKFGVFTELGVVPYELGVARLGAHRTVQAWVARKNWSSDYDFYHHLKFDFSSKNVHQKLQKNTCRSPANNNTSEFG